MSRSQKTAKDVVRREMMELAIRVMRESVHENRPDGSPSPLVGAVLVKPDGKIETAARGELRGTFPISLSWGCFAVSGVAPQRST